MRTAVIDGTTVINVIEAEPGFVLDGFTLIPAETVGPGWAFHPGLNTFSPPEPDLDALWDALRTERDRLLRESDWTQTTDAPVDQAAWAIYRQALRDLPQDTEDPANPDWPTPPES